MTGLKHTMAAIPGGSTRRTYGTAHWDGSRWFARIGDSLLDARWLDPIQPLQGGQIVIDITNDGVGQSSALVIGGYTDQPRPSTGTVTDVLPAGPSVRIVFTGEDGISYTTDRFIGSYNAGDPVYVTWDAAQPTVIGKVQSIVVPPAPAAPAQTVTTTSGQTALIATASDTFGVGGWGRWATSQRGGEDVYTGTQGGYTVTGAWFYGAPKPELAGKTINRVQFKVPARMAVGAHNAPVTIYLYAHTSGSRPGGDVTRVAGPFPVTLQPGSGGGYVDLDPAAVGPVIAAGGGISIAGGSYAALQGRLSKYNDRQDPESGKILMDWSN